MSTKKLINLGLQGGGAHGAFAWGVLDKLLEDGRIEFDGICACSAGTLNACALAYGLHLGGNDSARETLHNLWHHVYQSGMQFNPMPTTPWDPLFTTGLEESISYFWFESMTRAFSPYQLNPFDINPLKTILEDTIDFDAIRACSEVNLFISATHVSSGKVKVFENSSLDIDVALASACLPFLFKAVEIQGEHYWDGGYMGNPSLFPLFYKNDTRDIMIVHINPIERQALPKDASDIMNRVNEITFNSSLIKDMRSIAFVKKLLDNDMLKEEYRSQFKDIILHSIRADEALSDMSVASKFDTKWDSLTTLRDRGRATMGQWLEQHFDDVGTRDTVDIQAEFLSSVGDFFERPDTDII